MTQFMILNFWVCKLIWMSMLSTLCTISSLFINKVIFLSLKKPLTKWVYK